MAVAEKNIKHRYHYYFVSFSTWNLYSYLKEYRACPLKDKDVTEFSKQPTSWKIILELKTGNVVVSEVEDLYVCRTKQGKKHVPHGKLVGTTECIMLQPKCLYQPRLL